MSTCCISGVFNCTCSNRCDHGGIGNHNENDYVEIDNYPSRIKKIMLCHQNIKLKDWVLETERQDCGYLAVSFLELHSVLLAKSMS